ncbi:phosphoribosyltransferase [Falsiroseomonas sp. HW251]|uniref:phosphoribosyltransferase n=1 Tax=Falsiroseomonas sp. HW251 TaxID=3390998 RepID=UPI003D323FA0
MDFWQAFAPPSPPLEAWADAYAAPMPDGTGLVLPLRDMGETAVAGLIANQAGFAVVRALSAWMTAVARPLGAEVVVGLPTLGQVFAPAIAEALGHPNWVAPGWSRKRWYEERLSVAVHSITSPIERRLWLDPRLLPRLAGRRVLLVDDVISTGASARAGLALLAAAGVVPVALIVAMAQGDRWRVPPEAGGKGIWDAPPVRAVFATPIFSRTPRGWVPIPGSTAHDACPLMKDIAA